MIIDYSSWKAWMDCPAKWYELYVNRRRKAWPRAQRDDALALGSLVHAGLEVWQRHHVINIPDKTIEECTPTSECLNDALELVYGYTQHYPEERWPLIVCEEPVQFTLYDASYGWACATCGHYSIDYKHPNSPKQCPCCTMPITPWQNSEILTGLAKIDSYFYVEEPTTIESGQLGIYYTLNPGWWIHEYKTKSPYIPMALFMQKWEMNMQASFQTLALTHSLNRMDSPGRVQGVLVNVLEKPKRYTPKRKCKACEESYEFATWLPTGDGEYNCPVCGNQQALTKLKENPHVTPPAYYRIVVTRTVEQLNLAKSNMITIANRMISMQSNGLASEAWNTENCTQYKRACDYFSCHVNGVDSREEQGFIQVDDYRGLGESDEQ